MAIGFNSIPADVRTGGQFIEFDNSRAINGLPGMPMKALVIGQRAATAPVVAAIPMQIAGAKDAEAYFGRGSLVAAMANAFKAANAYTELWAIALDDAAGAAKAAGALGFGGPAVANGSLFLYIGGERIVVPVTSGDTAAQIATNVAAAINAMTDLPVTAAVDALDTTKVDLTCRWGGTTGNAIDLREAYYQGETSGAEIGAAVTITAMAGGATDPDISTVIAALGDVKYGTIVTAYKDGASLQALHTELLRRWGPMVMEEGQAFVGDCDTLSNLETLGTGIDSQFITIVGGGLSPTPPWVWAAVAAAVDAGEPDPARPRQTLPLPGLLAPAQTKLFTRDERDLLLHDGVSTFMVDAGGNVLIERLITTYETNAFGVPDESYLDLTTMRTLAYLRWAVRSRIALRFPRMKLADDGTSFGPGQPIVTPSSIKADLINLFHDWEEAGYVEDFTQFKKDLVVERDASDPERVNALLAPNLINQFRVFAGQIQFLL